MQITCEKDLTELIAHAKVGKNSLLLEMTHFFSPTCPKEHIGRRGIWEILKLSITPRECFVKFFFLFSEYEKRNLKYSCCWFNHNNFKWISSFITFQQSWQRESEFYMKTYLFKYLKEKVRYLDMIHVFAETSVP